MKKHDLAILPDVFNSLDRMKLRSPHFRWSSILVFSVSCDVSLLVSHNFSPKHIVSCTIIISFDYAKLWKIEWVNWSKVGDKGPGRRRVNKWRDKARFYTFGTKNSTTARSVKPKESTALRKEEKMQMKGFGNTWDDEYQDVLILILLQFSV